MWSKMIFSKIWQRHFDCLENLAKPMGSLFSGDLNRHWLRVNLGQGDQALSVISDNKKDRWILADSFYNVKYWTSIIMSNVRQINLSNENITVMPEGEKLWEGGARSNKWG